MVKKKVLVVGMLDSIHLARWLKQFVGTELNLLVFPSSYFRFPHPNLLELQNSTIHIGGATFFKSFLGYIDSLVTFRFFGNRFGQYMRQLYLELLVAIYRPDIIHAIEIQHAGYLVSSIKGGSNRRILTNWGSDIYYFQHIAGHQAKIRKALNWATHYSAECERDYQLAREYDFVGGFLPKIPNAGGFEILELSRAKKHDLRQLIVKCYGGKFGLGSIAIDVIDTFLLKDRKACVFLYSVTEDLLTSVKILVEKYPNRVNYSTISRPLSHEKLLLEFAKSRVYLGMSKSDGLSTSFLESLVMGVYPIQTDTSCANELLDNGAIGTVVPPNYQQVIQVLLKVFSDEKVLSEAKEVNRIIALKYLDFEKIKEKAKTFYEL